MRKVYFMVLAVCLMAGMPVFAVEPAENPRPPMQEMPVRGQMPPDGARGEMPPWQMPEATEQASAESMQTEAQSVQEGEIAEGNPIQRRNQAMAEMQGGMQSPDVSAEPSGVLGFLKSYTTPICSVVLLLGAFLFVKLYKRKMY